jgi:hypothetical protein
MVSVIGNVSSFGDWRCQDDTSGIANLNLTITLLHLVKVFLVGSSLSPVTLLGISILNLFLKCSLQVINRREF